jgi:hypothetical protein
MKIDRHLTLQIELHLERDGHFPEVPSPSKTTNQEIKIKNRVFGLFGRLGYAWELERYSKDRDKYSCPFSK